jgi:hypothetical protein
MGENLTLAGMLENQAWIGDVLRFPELRARGQRAALSVLQVQRGDGLQPGREADDGQRLVRLLPGGARAGHVHAGESFELMPGPREVGIPELFRSRLASQR